MVQLDCELFCFHTQLILYQIHLMLVFSLVFISQVLYAGSNCLYEAVSEESNGAFYSHEFVFVFLAFGLLAASLSALVSGTEENRAVTVAS